MSEPHKSCAHTPGPWFYDNPYKYHRVIHVAEGEIAQIFDESFPDGQGEANALLIAAAPDLLDALRAVRDYFSNPIRERSTREQLDCAFDIAKKINKAIAKGEGSELNR